MTEPMGTSHPFQMREGFRRERTKNTNELTTSRDHAMSRARAWRQFAYDSDDIAALYQADAWVKCARRCNHNDIATRSGKI